MIPKMQHFLDQAVHAFPKNIAVSFSGKSYTFLDIQQQSDNLASYLQQQSVERGDRVVLLLGNTVEMIISFWAVLKTGAIVIPVGSELKSEKLAYILKDSGAVALITHCKKVLQNRSILDNSDLKEVLVLNNDSADIPEGFTDLKAIFTSKQPEVRSTGLISQDLAAILYTSGSTGEPKGVMLSHDNMIAATHSLNTYLQYQPEDRILCALPLSFDYGLYQMIMACSTGALLVLTEEFTWPLFLLKKIVQEQISVMPMVPTMVMMLHEQNKKYQLELPSVRMATNTGAALTEDHIQMTKELFPNACIFSMYGLTECKRCTYLPPAEIDDKPKSVGIAIPNTEAWLVDEADHKITTPHTIGQLVIRGATVMQGYWNKPTKTAEKLRPGIYPGEKVLYTGDHFSFDQEGYLYFEGRMDHMINSRGIKVSPKEVEDFISCIAGVHAAVVLGVPHDDYGEALFAYVLPHEKGTVSETDILIACKTELENYKVPEFVSLIDSIPKTPNGKFNLLQLKKRALQEVIATKRSNTQTLA